MFMIETQNEFFDIIYNSSNENLKNYVTLFITEIMIQDCNKDEIINMPSFNDFNNNGLDIELNDDNDKIDLMKIIISNSYYYNNKYLDYNFDSIEDTLASLILPKTKRFNSYQNCLRTVIYLYEGFSGKKQNIINDYIEKYEQRKLNEEEIYILVDFIYKDSNININNFLISIYILIDIILSNNYDKNEKLYKITMNIDDSNIIILKNFFENIKTKDINKENSNRLFTVGCLVDFMNFVENLSWEKIRNSLNKDYLIELSEDIKDHIDKIYSNNDNNKISVSKELLSTALRRFISRYLIGKREENEIHPKNNLYHYLDKNELWSGVCTKDEKFKEDLRQIIIINENKYIMVGQATKLFDYLGGDLLSLEKMLINMKGKEKHKEDNDIENIKEKENFNNKNNNIIEINNYNTEEEEINIE